MHNRTKTTKKMPEVGCLTHLPELANQGGLVRLSKLGDLDSWDPVKIKLLLIFRKIERNSFKILRYVEIIIKYKRQM